MRALIVLALALVVVSGLQEVQLGYHASVGIPEARRIKALEEQFLNQSPHFQGPLLDERIVGGVSAPVNGHPYLAGLIISLLGTTGSSACGSVLISSNRLVTAAHCWFDGWNQGTMFTVVLGSHLLFSGGTRISTTTVFMHPLYSPANLNNDIAMIYLPSNVLFSNSIRPANLPSGSDLFDTFAGQWAVAAGYGKTADSQVGVSVNSFVSHVNLNVITVAQCAAVFGNVFVQPSTLCTSGVGGVGVCGGDSGGPLVILRNGEATLIGISSFVASTGCQLGHPSAFARVTSFASFINQNM